jgi:hypothetical protein
MKQYRITQSDIVPANSHIDDAVMSVDDLARIQKLAGIINEAEAGTYAGIGQSPLANNVDTTSMSPVGSNISKTAEQRNKLLEKYNVRPGTELWFIIMFSRPYLTGDVETKVKQYIKDHPESVISTDR